MASHDNFPGVTKRAEGGYHIRARAKDPRTGALREINKILPDCGKARDAFMILEGLREEIRAGEKDVAIQIPTLAVYAKRIYERRASDGSLRSLGAQRKWDYVLGYLDDGIGRILLDKLVPEDFNKFKREVETIRKRIYRRKDRKIKEGKLTPTTVNSILTILRSVCKEATIEFDLKDPMRGVKDFDESEHRVYSFDDPNSIPLHLTGDLLDHARCRFPDEYAMIYLMLTTGLRPSSLRPLRVTGPDADVDLDRGILKIRRSHANGQSVMNKTKTGRDQIIFMPPQMVGVIRWHLDRLAKQNEDRRKRMHRKPRTAHRIDAQIKAMAESELLFPAPPSRWNLGGGFRSATWLVKPFKALGKLLGLTYDITPRSMRRTYQDVARRAKVEGVVTRAISGHRTVEMQEHYSTVWADEMRSALASIIAVASNPPDPSASQTAN